MSTKELDRIFYNILQRDLEVACDGLESIMRDNHTPPAIARIVTEAYNAVIKARQSVDDLR